MQSPSDVDSIRSDLTSLSESIYTHVYENGRTYHAYGSGTYVCCLELNAFEICGHLPTSQVLPNDEREQGMVEIILQSLQCLTKGSERLDVMHHVFRLCLDGNLCQTKLEHPQRILDIGTGTGIWAVDSLSPICSPR